MSCRDPTRDGWIKEKTEIKFWAVLCSRGCREKLPTATKSIRKRGSVLKRGGGC